VILYKAYPGVTVDLPKLLAAELHAKLERRKAEVAAALDAQLQAGDVTHGFLRVGLFPAAVAA